MTVMTAKYPPRMTLVVKISANFQLSGKGDGFTLSFDIVMIVPETVFQHLIGMLNEVSLCISSLHISMPLFNIAIIRTMNGGKSNCHISAT